jgi:GT2 family glycosyltransferase
MCRRDVFEEVSGFEEDLPVAFNDVDFCFKLVDQGYKNIYLPHVVLYHYESKSRGHEDTPEKLARMFQETKYMQNKWDKIIKNDPCYNPHLTRKSENYNIEI